MGELISFRITDAELKALKELREEAESLNLAAQRLFRESLKPLTEVSDLSANVDRAVDATVNRIVDKIVDSHQFEEVLGDKVSCLVNTLNEKIRQYEERLELVEKN